METDLTQLPKRPLVHPKLVQGVPPGTQPRQQPLVLSHALKQGRCGAVDELGVCAGAPNAHCLFDRVGQSTQAVAQLARIFIGNAFAQKRLMSPNDWKLCDRKVREAGIGRLCCAPQKLLQRKTLSGQGAANAQQPQ